MVEIWRCEIMMNSPVAGKSCHSLQCGGKRKELVVLWQTHRHLNWSKLHVLLSCFLFSGIPENPPENTGGQYLRSSSSWPFANLPLGILSYCSVQFDPTMRSKVLSKMCSSWWFSTHLKNISQISSFPQVGVKIKNLWNHHTVLIETQSACSK